MLSSVDAAVPEQPHPLSPLTPTEIADATNVIRHSGYVTEYARFITIVLDEPDKHIVQSYPAGPLPERCAEVVLREPTRRRTFEARVSLTRASVTSWTPIPQAQPSLTPEEFLDCDRLVRTDDRWQKAMRRRDLTDLSLATVDAWSLGHAVDEADPDQRLVYAITFVRTGPHDNPYARPVENLVALVDLDRMEVLHVHDGETVPLPPRAGNYAHGLAERDDNWTVVTSHRNLAPIEITQPEGSGFHVDGHYVTWQHWSIRIGFTAREGLVLHEISYTDQDRQRPIIYRAALSEMYTPYADPGLIHQHKSAFDEGEYNAGFVMNSLSKGCDCLGEIFYFDVTVNNQYGAPVTIDNAICLHEEDYGVVWKHTDFRTGEAETRRNRRLVVSSFAVLGNYQYGYFWYFYVDGTIEFEVKLTGMISTGAFVPEQTPRYGTAVAPGLYGPNHQHYFNMRLDMCVDGNANSLYEINAEPDVGGPHNPFGNGWFAQSTLLQSELDAQRTTDPARGRYWLIANPSVHNRLGQPVGYKLVPGATAMPQADPQSPAGERAAFAYKHLWATRYSRHELYAAGKYPNQQKGSHGLPQYTARNRNITNTDLVVWYNFGDHHVVRPEDWPVMPVTTVGFALKPVGFFDGNPALDLMPPSCDSANSSRKH